MQKLKLLLEKETHTQKPTDTIAKINNKLTSNPVELTVDELIDAILKGQTWTLAMFSEDEEGKLHRTKKAWASQDLFALDFDHDITPEEFIEKATKFKIMPTFIYTSFSDSEKERRFRAVWVSDATITDYRDSYTTTICLMNIFKEADIQCKDPNRLYFGGKELLYVNKDNTINPTKAMNTLIDVEIDKDEVHYKRNIKKICEQLSINTINNLPQENVEKNAHLYIYLYKGEHISPSFNYLATEEEFKNNCIKSEGAKKNFKYKIVNTKFKEELIQRFNFKDLEDSCPFYEMAVKGQIWLYDNEFFGLATSLLRVRGGEKILKEIVNNMPLASETEKKILKNKIMYIKQRYTIPQRCENFCPKFMARDRKEIDMNVFNNNIEKCENCGLNMLQSVDSKRGELRLVEDIKTRTLEDIREELRDKALEVLDSKEQKIYVIKAPVGAGKTQLLNTLDQSYYDGLCIAVPSHKLGEEVKDRLNNIDNLFHIHDLDANDIIKNKYHQYQAIGSHKAAYDYLKKCTEKVQNEDERKKIVDYLEMLKRMRTTTRTVLCSHQRMLNLNNKNIDTYWIDEDPVSVLFPSIELSEVTVYDLIMKSRVTKGCESLEKAFNGILKAMNEAKETAGVIDVNIQNYDEKTVKKFIDNNNNDLKINVIDLLSVRKIVSDNSKNLLGMIKRQLPKGKIIITSATINKDVITKLMKDDPRNVEFIDLGEAELQGKYIIHNKSCSRRDLDTNFDKIAAQVKKEAPGVKNLISFKKYEGKFKKEGFNFITNFGNCTGLDAYNGQDLIVVGTPHINEKYYKLLASMCKEKVQIINSIEYQKGIRRNGFEFSFSTYNANENTYDADLLQEIQFYLIESELQQAVGRARAVMTNATVHIFSNYPLAQCQIYRKIK